MIGIWREILLYTTTRKVFAMNISELEEVPAAIMMLDDRRGDLFAILTYDHHWVIQVKEPLVGSDRTTRWFQRGYLKLGDFDEPAWVRLAQAETFIPCTPLPGTIPCDVCYGVMRIDMNFFICSTCGYKV